MQRSLPQRLATLFLGASLLSGCSTAAFMQEPAYNPREVPLVNPEDIYLQGDVYAPPPIYWDPWTYRGYDRWHQRRFPDHPASRGWDLRPGYGRPDYDYRQPRQDWPRNDFPRGPRPGVRDMRPYDPRVVPGIYPREQMGERPRIGAPMDLQPRRDRPEMRRDCRNTPC